MLNYLKAKLFGSKIFQRTSSVDVKSKYKSEEQQKRPLSIDSKQKEESIRQTTRKRQLPEVIEDESVVFVQREWTMVGQSFEFGGENLKNFVVSDAGQEEESFENLLKGLNDHDEDFSLSLIGEDTIGLKGRLIPNNPTSKKARNCPENICINGKFLIKRSTSKKVIKRIQEKCSVCKRYLSMSDSCQLACTHRCHNECVRLMRMRGNFKCDLCEGMIKKLTTYKK